MLVRGFFGAHLLADALEVVDAIDGASDCSIEPVLQDIKAIRNSFESIAFS